MGLAPPALLDENGHPLSARVQEALHALRPRFRLAFPLLRDEAVIASLMEQAGWRVIEAERRLGTIDKLHGYAWVTLRSVALSHLRGSQGQLAQATLGSAESNNVLAAVPGRIRDAGGDRAAHSAGGNSGDPDRGRTTPAVDEEGRGSPVARLVRNSEDPRLQST